MDAGTRQLRREAWLHNRLQMVVASFLRKDLRIDRRWGYAWFRETLVDHEPANDAGGWQWAASTGTDAQPFVRVFNPVSLAETHDPEGRYIREYVPEVADVSTREIHEWPTLDENERAALAPEYPSPIVDHADAREAALAMFRRARDEAHGPATRNRERERRPGKPLHVTRIDRSDTPPGWPASQALTKRQPTLLPEGFTHA